MTYLQFLAVFLMPPILLLVAVGARSRRARRSWSGLSWQLPLLAAVAIVYTGPWDGSLISQGVWSYPRSQVAGQTFLRVPIEEYGFYVLQVALAGLVTAALWRRLQRR